jgi:hypothetical protein
MLVGVFVYCGGTPDGSKLQDMRKAFIRKTRFSEFRRSEDTEPVLSRYLDQFKTMVSAWEWI